MLNSSCVPVYAPVAQWIRALVFGTRCRGFESRRERLGWVARTGRTVRSVRLRFFYSLLIDSFLSTVHPSIERARDGS